MAKESGDKVPRIAASASLCAIFVCDACESSQLVLPGKISIAIFFISVLVERTFSDKEIRVCVYLMRERDSSLIYV